MEFFKQWALNVCLCAIVGTIISMLSPKGRMDKIIKLMLSVFIFLSILSPFLKGDVNEFDFDFPIQSTSQDELIEKSNQLTLQTGKKAIEQKISDTLKENGFSDFTVEAVLKEKNGEIDVEKILITLSDNANKNQASDLIKSQFGFDTEVKTHGQ